MKTDDPLYDLRQLVKDREPYEDRLRSTNVREFTSDKILTQRKPQEFVRDTTLDPK